MPAGKVLIAIAIIAGFSASLWLLQPAAPVEGTIVRVGLLKSGTAAWESDTILRHGFDRANGVALDVVEFAGNDAGRIAIQSGDVDVIISDWLFVSRQRGAGIPLTFVPFSTAIGGLMVPPDGDIADLGDLRGKRLGVAGGPLDKSWLMLRAWATARYGFDLERETRQIYGAPPLLAEALRRGEVDAAINYWHFNARLEADGFVELIDGQRAAMALGASGPIPAVGYVFMSPWAEKNPQAVKGFLAASRQAKRLLADTGTDAEAEWNRLRPLMQADNDAVFAALQRRYRAGTPQHDAAATARDAERVYEHLVQTGGSRLVGASGTLAAGTFWPDSVAAP